MEEQLLKSTTRHIRIFSAEVNRDGELVPNNHVLTLDVDPDSTGTELSRGVSQI